MNDNDNIISDDMIREKHKTNQPGVRLSIEQVRSLFDDFGYTLISTEYKNLKTPLEYICNKHKDKGIQKIKYGNLIRSSKCPYCMLEENKYPQYFPLDTFQKATEEAGYIFKNIKYTKQHANIEFICPKHENRGIQISSYASIKNKSCACKYCNGTGRTTDDFIGIMSGINPDIDIIGEYKNAKTKIKCRCKVHDYMWESSPSNLMSGFGCKYCGYERTGMSERIPYDVKVAKLKERHGDDITFLSLPDLSDGYAECKCNKCGNEWKATYANLVKQNATGCPRCKSSSGEKGLIKIFDKYKLDYIPQKTFDGCKNIFPLRFDFYLPDYNCCIEFDGEQHYKPKNIGGISNEQAEIEFKATKHNDEIKNNYCLNNNMHLIRIPYWEKPNMELFLFKRFKDVGINIG